MGELSAGIIFHGYNFWAGYVLGEYLQRVCSGENLPNFSRGNVLWVLSGENCPGWV